MTALNKQALREVAVAAKTAGEVPVMSFDLRMGAFSKFTNQLTPSTVISLLDEIESLARANSAQDDHINQQQDRIDQLEKGSHEAAKQISSWRRIAKQNMEELAKLKELLQAEELLPEIECDICGFKSTDPDGAHHCCEDNSND
ncbi:hypothetical protein [Edwardsiella tarda]|uniref:hypothetical protein n=1 Tax=Edwardsiella tarda TaxID=636 RepID=UPI003F65E1B2